MVNTGTEPLYVESWHAQRHFARTDQLWAPFQVLPWDPTYGYFILYPGVAIGTPLPELMELLEPEEFFQSGGPPLVFLRQGPELSPSGPVTCEVALRSSDLFLDGSEHELRFELLLHSIPGTESVLRGAQRVTSRPVEPMIEELPIGCEAPGIGTLGISFFAAPTDPALPPSRIGLGSDLPYRGNEHAAVAGHMGYGPLYENATWILVASPDGDTVPLGGCDVLWPDAAASLLRKGIYTMTTGPLFDTDVVPFPIPDGPFVAGSEVTLQWLLLTPQATNGRCAASPGMRLHLEEF